MGAVAVPSLRKITRKSRTAASRALVSQQMLVAMPLMMMVVYATVEESWRIGAVGMRRSAVCREGCRGDQ